MLSIGQFYKIWHKTEICIGILLSQRCLVSHQTRKQAYCFRKGVWRATKHGNRRIAFAKVFGEPPNTETGVLLSHRCLVSHQTRKQAYCFRKGVWRATKHGNRHIAFAKVFVEPPNTEIASRLVPNNLFYFAIF